MVIFFFLFFFIQTSFIWQVSWSIHLHFFYILDINNKKLQSSSVVITGDGYLHAIIKHHGQVCLEGGGVDISWAYWDLEKLLWHPKLENSDSWFEINFSNLKFSRNFGLIPLSNVFFSLWILNMKINFSIFVGILIVWILRKLAPFSLHVFKSSQVFRFFFSFWQVCNWFKGCMIYVFALWWALARQGCYL